MVTIKLERVSGDETYIISYQNVPDNVAVFINNLLKDIEDNDSTCVTSILEEKR